MSHFTLILVTIMYYLVSLASIMLFSGVGAGIGAAIFAQITRTTTQSERTGVFSLALGLRQFGLLVGKYISICCCILTYNLTKALHT